MIAFAKSPLHAEYHVVEVAPVNVEYTSPFEHLSLEFRLHILEALADVQCFDGSQIFDPADRQAEEMRRIRALQEALSKGPSFALQEIHLVEEIKLLEDTLEGGLMISEDIPEGAGIQNEVRARIRQIVSKISPPKQS